MSALPWLWVLWHAIKVKKSEGQGIPRVVLFCMVYVSMPLCSHSSYMVLAMVLKHTTKSEPSGLAVSVGRISGLWPLSALYGLPSLINEGRGSAVKTVKSLQENLHVFEIKTQGSRLSASIAEVAWTLLCVVRNVSWVSAK